MHRQIYHINKTSWSPIRWVENFIKIPKKYDHFPTIYTNGLRFGLLPKTWYKNGSILNRNLYHNIWCSWVVHYVANLDFRSNFPELCAKPQNVRLPRDTAMNIFRHIWRHRAILSRPEAVEVFTSYRQNLSNIKQIVFMIVN